MLDIKKNINKKKMLANITFILFLCTSDFFFYTPQCLIDSVSYPVSPHDTFFLFGSVGCKTDILIAQRR